MASAVLFTGKVEWQGVYAAVAPLVDPQTGYRQAAFFIREIIVEVRESLDVPSSLGW